MRLLTIFLLCALAIGCGYGSNYNPSTGGTSAPAISQLSPSSTASGGAAFTLTVEGSNFTTGSIVYWGTTPMQTSFDSATQVEAAIPASVIANPGSVSVYVHSASGNSNSMTFTIN